MQKKGRKVSKPAPKMLRPVRVLSLSDFHTGNIAGLTPPEYNPRSNVRLKQYEYRRGLWEWFAREVDRLRPIDIVVANGDLVDGKGKKNGGTDQFTMDMNEQVEIAKAILKYVEAGEYHFTYGTEYHTGAEDDWEYQLAKPFGGDIQDVLTLDVNGLKMRWRHHTGSSQSQSSRANALMKQQEWDVLWATHNEFEKADVLIYAHAHYYQAVANRFGTAIIQPALQGVGGSQLGSRRLGALIDYGFLHFDVASRTDWRYQDHRLPQTPPVRSGIIPPIGA